MLTIRWLPVVMFLTTSALAQPAQSPDPAGLARQTLAAIDVFAEHHIAAPPQQEIVRQVIFAMRDSEELERPYGLGPRLAQLTQDEEYRQLLTEEWEQVQAALAAEDGRSTAESVMRKVLQGSLIAVPGRSRISEAEDHAVVEQLAANRYIGIGIALEAADQTGPPRMQRVIPDGPAHRAGAREGDVILEIDGIPTKRKPLGDVIHRLRGEAGTDVELLLQHGDDEPRRYTLTRGVVPFKLTHRERLDQDGLAIEVIRFDAITQATVSDLRKIEQEWETPPDAVLLDLQRGSDDLHHGVLLADALLDGGTIGRLVTAEGNRSFEAGREALFADMPLFVIVSGTTSGALEWVAAALQDQGRATVLGQQTAGQPFVSESFDVPGTNLVLTLTTGVLQRADGRELVDWERNFVAGPPVVFDRPPRGAKRPATPESHDGGVVPVRTIASRSQRPTQSKFAGRDFIGGPVTIEAALDAILPLLNAHDDGPETD